MSSEYTCEGCGKTFKSSWSEADSLMEYQENFSEEVRCDADGIAAVCDNCYRRFMKWAREKGLVA